VAKPMATAFVSFRGGTPATVTLVLRVWACLTSYSHVVHWEPVLGGRAPVCRKVGRTCSQPQGMFLRFETRRSGVGECAQPGEVPPQNTGWTLCSSAAPETPFQSHLPSPCVTVRLPYASHTLQVDFGPRSASLNATNAIPFVCVYTPCLYTRYT
jgi:hypothetical protein